MNAIKNEKKLNSMKKESASIWRFFVQSRTRRSEAFAGVEEDEFSESKNRMYKKENLVFDNGLQIKLKKEFLDNARVISIK